MRGFRDAALAAPNAATSPQDPVHATDTGSRLAFTTTVKHPDTKLAAAPRDVQGADPCTRSSRAYSSDERVFNLGRTASPVYGVSLKPNILTQVKVALTRLSKVVTGKLARWTPG